MHQSTKTRPQVQAQSASHLGQHAPAIGFAIFRSGQPASQVTTFDFGDAEVLEVFTHEADAHAHASDRGLKPADYAVGPVYGPQPPAGTIED